MQATSGSVASVHKHFSEGVAKGSGSSIGHCILEPGDVMWVPCGYYEIIFSLGVALRKELILQLIVPF